MNEEFKISVFCNHIEEIALQEGITFEEAARMVRDFGYTGADVYVTQSPEEIDILDSLGFKHACCLAEIDLSHGPQDEQAGQAFRFMEERGYSQVLLIAGLLDEGASQAELEGFRARIIDFGDKAAAHGFQALIEDYDNVLSPLKDTAGLDAIFQKSVSYGHAYDSGNYLFVGEDCLEALGKFLQRIKHVHLKDRISADDMTCPAVGSGCIPVASVIKALTDAGYDGWYTAEMFFSKQMLSDVRDSFKNISAMMEGIK